MSIANEISRLQTAKADIKSAIEAKGVSVPSSASISTYDDYVLQIQTGGGGSCTDTQVLTDLIERDLTSIVIPSATTSIGDYVFYDCYGLTSVTIPNGVTSIGSSAFRNCISLTSVTIPNSVTSIGRNAFTLCTSLTSATIGNSVTSIGQEAFYDCYGLTSITIEATTPPTLGNRVFNNTNDCPIYVPCSSVDVYKAANNWSTYASRIQCIQPSFDGKYKFTLTDDSVVSGECDASSAITTNETEAYRTTLKEAVVGDCVTSINGYAFYICSGLTSIEIPSGVTSIGELAFYRCSSLTNINIPDSVTNIGLEAFDGCSSLTSVTIPDSVTSIGDSAFSNCSGLTSIDIPDSVTSIGGSAFYNCSGLTSVTVNAITPPTLVGSYVFYNTNNCPIYVPSESVETYKAASGWSTYASRIQAIS